MKIGILTFHASHNFGSMLQNYALQQFLMAEGHIVETINLRIEKQKYMYNHPLRIGKSNRSIRAVLGRFKDPKWVYKESKGWFMFERFLKSYIKLTKEYHNWNEIEKDLPKLKYDAIITGGDQIWNTFCYDFDWSYFLPRDISPTKKIAYSPSFGNKIKGTNENKVLSTKIKEYLRNFDALSIREKDASDFLKALLGKDVPIVADPTLIVNPDIYLKLIGKPLINEPYIYYYTPSHIPDFEAENIAREIAKIHHIKIVNSYSRFRSQSGMTERISGPKEFLNLVKNAQFVLGKSYHLVIFSIIFHKNFATIKGGNDARINSLLKLVKIGNRNIDQANDFHKLSITNYKIVEQELDIFRERSINYLRNSLAIF